jgi:hypothetical protein
MMRLVIVTATTDNTLKVSLVETSLAYDCLMVISAASEDSVGAILVCYLQVQLSIFLTYLLVWPR